LLEHALRDHDHGRRHDHDDALRGPSLERHALRHEHALDSGHLGSDRGPRLPAAFNGRQARLEDSSIEVTRRDATAA
jgi:hypothetical protein